MTGVGEGVIGAIARSIDERRGTAMLVAAAMEVRGAAGDTGTASQRVLTASRELERDATRPTHEVSDFLDGVRAA